MDSVSFLLPATMANQKLTPEQVSYLQTQTNCDVLLQPWGEQGDCQLVHILGEGCFAATGIALQAITEITDVQSDAHCLTLYAKPEHCGSIIGRGGKHIVQLRHDNPNVMLNMDKEPVEIPMGHHGMQTRRPMTFAGTISDVSNALLGALNNARGATDPNWATEQPAPTRNCYDGFSVDPMSRKRTRPEDDFSNQQAPRRHDNFMARTPMAYNLAPLGVGDITAEFLVNVPSGRAGHLIGKGGSTIASLRESTNCKLIMDKAEVPDVQGIRLLRCGGTLAQLQELIPLLRDVLEQQQ